MIWRWCPLFHLPAQLLLLLLDLPSPGHAYPNFTAPAPGSTVELPTIQAAWNDTGTQPLISELTSYTLNLMMGGNDKDNMRVLLTFTSDGLYINSGNSGNGSLSATAAGELKNAFFFQLVSTTQHDTQMWAYSDRFSIAGLTGSNLPVYINAVNALKGSTKGPPPSGVASSAIPSASSKPDSSKSSPSTVFVTSTPTSVLDSTTSSQPASSESSGSGSSNNSSGLSTGAEIGIGLAFGVAGTASLLIAIFFVWRKHRARRLPKSHHSPATSSDSYDDPMAKPELPAEGPRRKQSTRLGFRQLAEADEGVPMSEMDSMNTKFELEGDSPPLAEMGTGRLSVSSDAVSTECGTLSSQGSYTLPPGSPRPPVSPWPLGNSRPPGFI